MTVLREVLMRAADIGKSNGREYVLLLLLFKILQYYCFKTLHRKPYE